MHHVAQVRATSVLGAGIMMRAQTLVRLLATVVGCNLLCGVAQAKCELKAFEIPVVMSGLRALATLRLNGAEARFVVDSGAFFSSITEAGAAELGLAVKAAPNELRQVAGITGAADMRMTTVDRIGLVNSELKDFEFLVGGNEPGSGALGLLGRNFLSYTDTEYDLPHGVIRLMRPSEECGESNLVYWSDDAPIKGTGLTPVTVIDLLQTSGVRFPPIVATVRVGGKEVKAGFDTGAPRSILSLSAARAIGVARDTKEMDPAGPVTGIGPGRLPSWNVAVGAIEFGQERIDNCRVQVADFHLRGIEMVVGIDFFLTHRIYVSVPRRRIHIAYTGGPIFGFTPATSTVAMAEDADQPKDASAYARRGMARAAHGDLERALADLNRACELDSGVALHRRERSIVHARLKHWPEALVDADEALRIDPSDTDARLHRIQLLGSSGQMERVRADVIVLDRQLAPQADMRRALVDIEMRLGNYAAVITQADLWIAAHPDDVGVHSVLNQRCWGRAMLGSELDQALSDCNRAIEGRPNEARFIDSRGVVRLRRNEWREAVADFDTALTVNPKLPWSLLGRGIARSRLGNTEAGRDDIDAARALRPTIEDEARRHGINLP
jgi:predicted aspartyl protease/tetratricopeptide (TPR) repeat protein